MGYQDRMHIIAACYCHTRDWFPIESIQLHINKGRGRQWQRQWRHLDPAHVEQDFEQREQHEQVVVIWLHELPREQQRKNKRVHCDLYDLKSEHKPKII